MPKSVVNVISGKGIIVKLELTVQRFYFDHNATTPIAPEVLEALLPALADVYGNASSIHYQGQLAKQRLEMARRQVGGMLHADAREIVFVSGGTEANNLAIFGSVMQHSSTRQHVITSVIEHPAVLNPCAELERSGVDVTRVPVGSDGVIDPEDVERALRVETVLISIMHANNETGALQPVPEIARIARRAGVRFHVDGIQAAGKIAVDVQALGADLYSISGHKLNAPKGIGALYVRKGLKLQPILFGGRHERERRAGTENVPGAVALGRAAERPFCGDIGALRDRLEQGILARVPDCGVNAGRVSRVPNTCNVYFDGIEGEALVISLDLRGFAVSSGSACSSGSVEPSHVLLGMGLAPGRARSSLRFSLGAGNTVEQVDALIGAIADSAARLRQLSPTYAAHA